MKIEEITAKIIWEEFASRFSPSNFLTSWDWADFNQRMGDLSFRLGIWEGDQLVGICLVLKVKARRGDFLLCPAGPLFYDFNSKYFRFIVQYLRKLAEKEKVRFIRIRPTIEVGNIEKIIEEENFKGAPSHVHAQFSWILDITKKEEELLADMRKSTRYLIKHSDKDELFIKEKNDLSGIRILEELQEETVDRHKFTPFSTKYIEKEFEVFFKHKQAKILVSYKGNQALAAAMIIFYGNSAFYHHGASIRTKTSATYLLQWEAIKKAKEAGKKYYNFWGIAPNDLPNHPLAGLTYFKQGFGGFKLEYTRAYDLPTSLRYPFIYWFEKLRSVSRGLSFW